MAGEVASAVFAMTGDAITDNASADFGDPLHPYYPLGVAIPSYVANTLSTQEILAIFSSVCGCILLPTWHFTRRFRPDLPANQIFTVLWFVLCGFIHLGLEGKLGPRYRGRPCGRRRPPRPPSLADRLAGYYALHHHDIAGRPAILAQLWKEYSLSDSRYLTSDAFMVCMETVTAVCWGPLSFVCAWFIVADHPLRYPLQSIISLGQLYGDILYYSIFAFDFYTSKVEYSRPEQRYFWGYFMLMNAFWIVIPVSLIIQSTLETGRAFAKVQAATQKKTGK